MGEEAIRRAARVQEGRACGGLAAGFPPLEVGRAVGRVLPGRAGGLHHAGWALRSKGSNATNCHVLKDCARQVHTTINQMVRTKI